MASKFGSLLAGILSAGEALPKGMDVAAEQAQKKAAAETEQLYKMLNLQQTSNIAKMLEAGRTARHAEDITTKTGELDIKKQAEQRMQRQTEPITVPPLQRKPGEPDAGHVILPPLDPRIAPSVIRGVLPPGGRGSETALRVELSTQLRDLESRLRSNPALAQDPEFRALYEDVKTQLDRHTMKAYPAFGGLTGAGTQGGVQLPPMGVASFGVGKVPPSAPAREFGRPATVSPEQAGAMGVAPGTPVEEAIRQNLALGGRAMTAQQRNQRDSALTATAVIESIEKDLVQLSKIPDWQSRFTEAPSRWLDVVLQRGDPRVSAAYSRIEGSLAKIIRALGEVGTLTEGDVQRARELWPVIVPSITTTKVIGGFPFPTGVQIPDTDAVVAQKFQGLRELLVDMANRTGLPLGQTPWKGTPEQLHEAITGGRSMPGQGGVIPSEKPTSTPPTSGGWGPMRVR